MGDFDQTVKIVVLIVRLVAKGIVFGNQVVEEIILVGCDKGLAGVDLLFFDKAVGFIMYIFDSESGWADFLGFVIKVIKLPNGLLF